MRLKPPAVACQMATLLAVPLPAAAQAPAPTAAPAPPISVEARHAEDVTSRIVPGHPNDVRAWLEGRQIISFFPKTDKIPAIAKVEVTTPKWFAPGGQRRVTFVDGNTVDERVVRYDAQMFQYQICGFTNSARWTVDYILGSFEYTAATPETTRVTWTYRMKPRWSLAFWPVNSFLSGTFIPLMEAAMDNMAAARGKAAGLK